MAFDIVGNVSGCHIKQAFNNTECGRNFYDSHHCLAPAVVTTLSVPEAFVNTLLWPLKMLVGSVALPIIGAALWLMGKNECCGYSSSEYFLAGFICVLGFSATIGFVALIPYMNLTATVAIFVSAIAISIIYHTKEACKRPSMPLV